MNANQARLQAELYFTTGPAAPVTEPPAEKVYRSKATYGHSLKMKRKINPASDPNTKPEEIQTFHWRHPRAPR